jgi:hypothetical protein
LLAGQDPNPDTPFACWRTEAKRSQSVIKSKESSMSAETEEPLGRGGETSPTSPPFELPEGVRRARAAFLRDFAKLIADRKTRGKFVCYHNDELVLINSDYWAINREADRKFPMNSFLVFEVVPDAEVEERAFENEEFP